MNMKCNRCGREKVVSITPPEGQKFYCSKCSILPRNTDTFRFPDNLLAPILKKYERGE